MSLDSQLHISNARLNEAHTEIRSLTGRQALLQNRIEELEKVIEQLRAQEFRSRALVAQEQGSDPDSLLAVQVCILTEYAVHAPILLIRNTLPRNCAGAMSKDGAASVQCNASVRGRPQTDCGASI